MRRAVNGARAVGWNGALARPQPLILVADDDEMILQVVAIVLEGEGYRVASARNGAEALSSIAEERPALLLLDMRMPIKSGWDVAEELRREGGPPLPIVVMTATMDAAPWAAEIGATAHLTKPFDLDHLVDVVRRLAPPAE